MTKDRLTDHFAESLSDYVDTTLGEQESRTLEAHMAACDACRALCKDLRDIKEQASSLSRLRPPDDAWRRIAVSLRVQQATRPPGGTWNFSKFRSWSSWGTLAAAAVLVIASVLVLGLWNPFSTAPPDQEQLANWVVSELVAAEKHYENAISGLEKIVTEDEDLLEPEVMAVLDENLTLIDQAIGESRVAAIEQPESEIARESLLGALRNKLSLLQNTILMINEVRKGQGQNAYDIINKMRESQNSLNPS